MNNHIFGLFFNKSTFAPHVAISITFYFIITQSLTVICYQQLLLTVIFTKIKSYVDSKLRAKIGSLKNNPKMRLFTGNE